MKSILGSRQRQLVALLLALLAIALTSPESRRALTCLIGGSVLLASALFYIALILVLSILLLGAIHDSVLEAVSQQLYKFAYFNKFEKPALAAKAANIAEKVYSTKLTIRSVEVAAVN